MTFLPSSRLPASGPAAQRGFTLIELMIVVVIVGILASVAYPSYLGHVRKGRRADAQSVMLEAQQYMQRYYAAHNSYKDAALPDDLKVAPKSGTTYYNLSVDVDDDGLSYSLSAAPVQSEGDPCGTLTLTDTGAMSQSAVGSSVDLCWR